MGWQVVLDDEGRLHVVPTKDLRPHTLAADCLCGPHDDEGVLVHDAFDCRLDEGRPLN